MALGLVTAVGVFVAVHTKWLRLLCGLEIIFGLFALVLYCSRAALFAVFVGVVLLCLENFKERCKFVLNRSIVTSVTVTILVIVLISLYYIRPASANGRLLIWRVCLDIIAQRPLFGFGISGLEKNYMLFQAEYFHNNPASLFVQYADNNVYAFNELFVNSNAKIYQENN